MTGILLIFVVALWLVIAFFVAKLIAILLPKRGWAYLLRVILFLGLIPLPLIDEIVGQSQFEKLCSENSTIQVDRAKAAGKTVYLADLPDVEVKGTWVRIVLKPWRYVDTTTGEIVVSYNTLQAVGGRFVHVLGISESGVPLTFRGYCKPGDQYSLGNLFKELGMISIRRPDKNDGDLK